MADDELDEIDQAIVNELLRDGRISIRQLAENLHISRTTAHLRFEQLQRMGVVTGFRAIVDYEKLGRHTFAYVSLRIQQSAWGMLNSTLNELPEIRSIAYVTGDFDIILLVLAKNNADLKRIVLDVLARIPGVRSTHTTLLFDFETRPAFSGWLRNGKRGTDGVKMHQSLNN